jgi:hypothetical protein
MLVLSVRQITADILAQRGESASISSSNTSLYLDTRQVTIEPGGRYSFKLSGSIIAWGFTGTASLSSDLGRDATAIIPNLYSNRSGGTEFTIAALGNQPATFLLARISRDQIEEGESTSTTFSQIAANRVTLPDGEYIANFSIDSLSDTWSPSDETSTGIIQVISGSAQLSSSNETVVHTENGELVMSTSSTPITLAPNDWFLAKPGDQYELTRSDPNTQVLQLWLGPILLTDSATPIP